MQKISDVLIDLGTNPRCQILVRHIAKMCNPDIILSDNHVAGLRLLVADVENNGRNELWSALEIATWLNTCR